MRDFLFSFQIVHSKKYDGVDREATGLGLPNIILAVLNKSLLTEADNNNTGYYFTLAILCTALLCPIFYFTDLHCSVLYYLTNSLYCSVSILAYKFAVLWVLDQ